MSRISLVQMNTRIINRQKNWHILLFKETIKIKKKKSILNTRLKASKELQQFLTDCVNYLSINLCKVLIAVIVDFYTNLWCVSDLVSFVQFKKRENSHGGVLLLACNFIKINTPPWVFFTFFTLYKWSQIAQSTPFAHVLLLIFILSEDGFDGSRNIGPFIILTYFVLFSWL